MFTDSFVVYLFEDTVYAMKTRLEKFRCFGGSLSCFVIKKLTKGKKIGDDFEREGQIKAELPVCRHPLLFSYFLLLLLLNI